MSTVPWWMLIVAAIFGGTLTALVLPIYLEWRREELRFEQLSREHEAAHRDGGV